MARNYDTPTTITINYMSLLVREYPEYYAELKDELLYEFGDGKKEFRGDHSRVATAYPVD